VRLLYGLVHTLAWLSRVYNQPLMLWTSANAWGLKRSGGMPEAARNLAIVHETAREVDGRVAMLLAWGWNIRTEGVYDDEGGFTADKDMLIEGVSRLLAGVRDGLADRNWQAPARVVHVPRLALEHMIGERQVSHLAEGLVDLSTVDFSSQPVVYLADGRALEAARGAGTEIVNWRLDSCVTPSVIRAVGCASPERPD
jgi:hypothetical protein